MAAGGGCVLWISLVGKETEKQLTPFTMLLIVVHCCLFHRLMTSGAKQDAAIVAGLFYFTGVGGGRDESECQNTMKGSQNQTQN